MSNHVRISNIDFNYLTSAKMLMVSYPDGKDDMFRGLSKEQANEKIGEILEKIDTSA